MGYYMFHIDHPSDIHIEPILVTIQESILDTQRNYHEYIKTPKLMIHLCFLYQGFSLQKEIPFDNESDLRDSLEAHTIDLDINDYRLRSASRLNDWNLHLREPTEEISEA